MCVRWCIMLEWLCQAFAHDTGSYLCLRRLPCGERILVLRPGCFDPGPKWRTGWTSRCEPVFGTWFGSSKGPFQNRTKPWLLQLVGADFGQSCGWGKAVLESRMNSFCLVSPDSSWDQMKMCELLLQPSTTVFLHFAASFMVLKIICDLSNMFTCYLGPRLNLGKGIIIYVCYYVSTTREPGLP